MNKNEFIEQVQKPYQDLWKCLVIVQQACVNDSQEYWDMYMREAERYLQKYPGNPFAYRCGRFLLDCADDIKKLNEGEN